jgi:hypothetical protein
LETSAFGRRNIGRKTTSCDGTHRIGFHEADPLLAVGHMFSRRSKAFRSRLSRFHVEHSASAASGLLRKP